MTQEVLKWILIFGVALFGLIKSSDYFTEYSEKLGKIVGIPQFIIGVTIISLGTSLPELMTSFLATLDNESSIVSANVVGSNIANLLLVGGVSILLSKGMNVEKSLIKVDLPILVAVTSLLIAMLWDGEFNIIEGAIMVITYVIYVSYNYHEHRNAKVEAIKDALDRKVNKEELDWKIPVVIGFSAVGIYFGAKYTVTSVTEISSIFNIAPSVIAVTAIAIGTSLPELLVSYKAVKRKNYELVVGNILGSNIFNSTLVMAVPVLISPLQVSNEVLTTAVPFLIIATILFAFSGIERHFNSFEGALYGLLYILFIGQLFNFI